MGWKPADLAPLNTPQQPHEFPNRIDTHIVAALTSLDWTFTVYADGSLKVQTPQGRPDLPELKLVVGPSWAKALATLIESVGDGSCQALLDFGPVNPDTVGRAG